MKDDKLTSIKDLRYFFKDKKFNKVFIVAGKKSYFLSGAEKIFDPLLKAKNKQFFLKSSTYPEINELKKLILLIKKFQPDLILAIGGGSVIDYAKIANLDGIYENLEKKIKENSYNIKKKIAKIIAIPTTAGSGAEVTTNAVIYINKIKYSIEDKHLKPFSYFLIPSLIIKNSKELKSSAGFDAISQAVESLVSVKSTLKSIAFSEKSLNLSLKNYLNFIKKPSFENCSKMSLAAMYSGRAISITKTTAPHAVSYPFTSLFNISHGHAVSLTLEKFLKFNYLNNKKSICNFNLKNRYDEIFKIFKVKNIYDLEKYIKNIKKKAKLIDDFKTLNIDIKNNYHKIIEGINIQRLKNNPVKIDQSDIKFILLNKLL